MIYQVKESIVGATADVILIHGHGKEFCDGQHSTIQQVLGRAGDVVRRVIEGFLPMDPGMINHVFLRNKSGELLEGVGFGAGVKCIVVGSAIGDGPGVIKKILIETIRFVAARGMKSIAMSRIGMHSVKITYEEWWKTFYEVVEDPDIKRQLHNSQIDIYIYSPFE
jgi:hypothetical protein